MNKKKIINFLKILFGLAIIGFLVFKIDFSKFLEIDFYSNIEYLLLSVFLLSFSLIVLQSLRLHVLIKEFKVGYKESVKLVMLGSFFNSFLPSNIGGDGYKILYLKKKYNITWDRPFSLIFIERFSGLSVLLLMGFVYVLIFYKRLRQLLIDVEINVADKLLYIIGAVLVLMLLFVLIYVFKPTRTKLIITKITNTLKSSIKIIFRFNKADYLIVFLYSVLIHAMRLFGFYYLIVFLDCQIYWADLMLLLSVTAFISMIPITIGAIGVREGVISVILIIFGVPENEAIIVSLLNRVILTFISALGAIVYMRSDFKLKNSET